jgi:hypothetical protein
LGVFYVLHSVTANTEWRTRFTYNVLHSVTTKHRVKNTTWICFPAQIIESSYIKPKWQKTVSPFRLTYWMILTLILQILPRPKLGKRDIDPRTDWLGFWWPISFRLVLFAMLKYFSFRRCSWVHILGIKRTQLSFRSSRRIFLDKFPHSHGISIQACVVGGILPFGACFV